jgi:hypothetical protein
VAEERVGTLLGAAEELAHDHLVALGDLTQAEAARLADERHDRPTLADGNRDHRRLEADLLHPAREHPAAVLLVLGGEDEEPRRDAAEGRADRLPRFFVHEGVAALDAESIRGRE